MMRTRLRPMPTARQLAKLYARPHEHTKWFDHRVRVDVTVAIAGQYLNRRDTIADLSCGDAAIPRWLAAKCEGTLILGDFAPGYGLTGPIEKTIEEVPQDSVDMWVCSETIEHLDDPDKVLRRIRNRTRRMILSTPMGETNPKLNPEHVWGWDAEAVGVMLDEAGFTPLAATTLDLRPAGYVYCYQIWMVE